MHQDACQSHQKGPLCARIWKRADQTDPTGAISATATDDGDSVGVKSADDASGNAWIEDSDDI